MDHPALPCMFLRLLTDAIGGNRVNEFLEALALEGKFDIGWKLTTL